MFNLNSLILCSEEPNKLVDFYRRVFAAEPAWEMEGYSGFQVGFCTLMIGPHSEVRGPNPNPARLMLNFETGDVKGESARLKKLGVKIIAEPYTMGEEHWIATFADPDGNYFQLVSPMKM